MSKNGASKDYQFPTKKHWRRWAWNRIADFLPNPAEALCLYLPSSEDADRVIATRKGFRHKNLVGVERNNRALMSARKSGGLVISGDFFDAVAAVQRRRKVDVVFADLCCGLTIDVVCGLLNMWAYPNTRDAVFAFNLLRGRETGISRSVLEMNKNQMKEYGVYDSLVSRGTDKHRGLGLWAATTSSAMHVANIKNLFTSENKVPDFHIYSYRSNNQIFDSIIGLRPITLDGFDPDEMDQVIANDLKGSATAASAAAVMAHRTRLIHGAGCH